jgi:long-chain acyl-CoA synthetase
MPLDNNSQPQPTYPWINSYPKDLRWDADIPDRTIPELFDKAVKDNKDKTAIDFMGKTYTYADLGAMVDRFAKSLQDQGIGPGSKVGLSLPNVPFYPIAYYAILKTGATVANFNPLYGPEELKHQVEDSDIEMMVGMNLEMLYPTVAGALGTAKLKKLVVCDMADVLPTTKAVGFRVLNALTDLTKNISLFDINKKIAALRDKNGVQPVSHIKKSNSILSFKDMLNSKGAVKPVEIHPNDVAVLQYTGGTTGVPKAAMLTHGNITANTMQAGMWFATGAAAKTDVRALAILPFYHVFSMTVMMNLPLYLGGEIIMLPKFDPKETLKTITEKKPSIFAGVPTLYKVLSKEIIDNPGKYNTSSLDVCISGAAPLPPETAAEFKKLTGVDLLEGYGLSESSAAALANPVYGEKRAGSIGLPVPGTEIKIDQSVLTDDPKLKAALLEKSSLPGGGTPINVDGEICLRGPQIMKGYWKRPDETAKTIDKDGWLHTGDIGRLDKDGYVSITGRLKEMIIVSGLKAFPRKIEESILKNDAIDDVAVIGLPDERTGEKVKAYIVLKPGKTITDEELTEFLRPYLARYEVPKAFERRTSLPLTAIGKPDHKALRKEEEAKVAAASTSTTAKKANNGPKL